MLIQCRQYGWDLCPTSGPCPIQCDLINKAITVPPAVLPAIFDRHWTKALVFVGLIDTRDVVEGNYRDLTHAPAMAHSVKNSAPNGSRISRNTSSTGPKH